MNATSSVPPWPRIEAVTRPDGTGEFTIDGTSHPIQAATVEEARQTILARIADTAAKIGRPVRVTTSGPDGQRLLIVHPDGAVQADDSRPTSPAPAATSPSVFAPKTASTGEAATPEPPVTGAADPAVEEPDSDPWAGAALLAQTGATSTKPREIADPAPVNQPTFLELPDENTVVRANGEAVDATPAPAEPAAPGRRRIVLLTVAAVGAWVLVAAGTAAVVALTGNSREPGPTASVAALPGEGANLPAQAPAGYDRTAVWSVPVSSEPQILLTPDGGVLAAPVGDDRITILGRATGTTIWEGRDPVEDLHLAQFGEEPVLAADSPGTLHVWPLDTTDPAGVAPTTIELGSDQAEVSYDGPAPLIVLPDRTVALLDGKSATPVRRDVPAGATPVAAAPERVIAVGPDAWWTITADADPVRHSLPKPKQAIGEPTATIAVGGNQLAVVWRTADSAKDVLALLDMHHNAIRATSLVRSSAVPSDAEPLRDHAGSTRTIGPVLLDVGPEPMIADLGDITPEAVIGSTVYGTSKNKPAVATWSPDGVNLEVTENPGETALIAALTKDVAFVVASKDTETFLYALPASKG